MQAMRLVGLNVEAGHVALLQEVMRRLVRCIPLLSSVAHPHPLGVAAEVIEVHWPVGSVFVTWGTARMDCHSCSQPRGMFVLDGPDLA